MTIDDPDRLAEMKRAFARRDRTQDGRFFVAVTSTGIYCRPSCPARRPRPEHIRFFANEESARAAGFRPCLRCKPNEALRDRAAVAQALDTLRQADAPVSLEQLGDLTGYSPAHFQRVFKAQTGLSPFAYAKALREERARDALSSAPSVSAALYEAGFEAPSRFYDAMQDRLGMSPSAWAKGGQGMKIRWAVVETTLAPMLVAATDKGVCRLAFNEGPEELAVRFPQAELVSGDGDFAELLARVVAAVEVPGSGDDIPLDVRGTAFQEAVWRELRKIPKGETRSYAQIAAAAGNPRATRAAGSANGANNVAVLIPCHRVVRSDGAIGGYAYGTEIKEELLRRERSSES